MAVFGSGSSREKFGRNEGIVKDRDARYLEIILDCVRVCSSYRPKFGQGRGIGLTLGEFQDHYGKDPFYGWFGLDNPMMYAAHKAAGGMTSIYRQIGIGSERVFRKILQDTLELSETDVVWSYTVPASGGKTRRLSLDGRVPLESIRDSVAKTRFRDWMKQSADTIGIEPRVFDALTGAVFEVRQGYKSKDSKRQNADIANASSAYIKSYLPCAVVLSNQIDEDILRRYRSEGWAVTTGVIGRNDPLTSTYDFMREVVGYDLAGFFERSRNTLRAELKTVLEALLAPGDP